MRSTVTHLILSISLITTSCCSDRGSEIPYSAVADRYLPYSEGDRRTFLNTSDSSLSDTLDVYYLRYDQDRDKTRGDCCCAYYQTKYVRTRLAAFPQSSIDLKIGFYSGVKATIWYRDSIFSDHLFEVTQSYTEGDNAFMATAEVGGKIYSNVFRFTPKASNSPEIKSILVAKDAGVIQVTGRNGDTLNLK
ncbi:MAG: hypothetical protein V4616_11475 [Bacteroidota bacterium]